PSRTAMSIRDWPRTERPREKLLERGPHMLSDAELLAVLIGCGRKGLSAVELARALIVAFGSLRELLSADRTRWVQEPAAGKPTVGHPTTSQPNMGHPTTGRATMAQPKMGH